MCNGREACYCQCVVRGEHVALESIWNLEQSIVPLMWLLGLGLRRIHRSASEGLGSGQVWLGLRPRDLSCK